MQDVISEFREAMRVNGVPYTGEIVADGELHRCYVEGDRRGSQNGWYVLYNDGRPAGAFGSMRAGREKHTWTAKGTKPLTAAERTRLKKEIEENQAGRAAELAKERAEAAAKANSIWDAAADATDHPYLKRKQVKGYGLKTATWVKDYGTDSETGEVRGQRIANALLVPVHNVHGAIVSLQAIFADNRNALKRDKDLLTGGEKQGCWYTIPAAAPNSPVVICEGYATGASIHMATGFEVAVAFDAGNLLLVAEQIRSVAPKRIIVVAADNDQWTTAPIANPGLNSAKKTAKAVRGVIAVPKFKTLDGHPTDFNDLLVREGLGTVKAQILAAVPQKARPLIQIRAGEAPRIIDEAENALIHANMGLYQRGSLIVRPAMVPIEVADGRPIELPRLLQVAKHHLAEAMSRAADFQRYDKQKDAWVKTDCPIRYAETLLAREGQWKLPVLTGVINAPTLRRDGSILAIPGYDAATGLLFDPLGTVFPTVPEKPGRAAALTGLNVLRSVIETFPFVGNADRAVALSSILTALVRRLIGTAPLHAFSAPTAGSGKSKLVDIASIIATGHEASVMAQGKNEEEMEKRLGAALMAGDALISIDNCEQPLGGELLCQALTQKSLKVRVLGKSMNAEVPNNAAIFATGNNLIISGDMCRRSLLCCLDAGVERPELRSFDRDPIGVVMGQRAKLVVAGLTILRAYWVAGKPRQVSQLGSFSEWSDLVRSALIWLGEADPCVSMEEARKADPKLEALAAIMTQWHIVFQERRVTVKEVIDAVRPLSGFHRPEYEHPDLREALLVVAGENGCVNGKRLGKWLSSHQKKLVAGMKIVADGTSGGAQKWKVICQQQSDLAA